MGLTTSRNFGPLDEIPLVDRTLLQDVGDLAIRMIRERTERGISVDGGAFEPLSAGYAERKAEAGLPAVANLTVSGRMLNDMAAKPVDRRTVEIAFLSRGGKSQGSTFIQRSRGLGAADKAFFHHVAGAGRSRVVRRFFDLNAKELAIIEARVRRHLDQVL